MSHRYIWQHSQHLKQFDGGQVVSLHVLCCVLCGVQMLQWPGVGSAPIPVASGGYNPVRVVERHTGVTPGVTAGEATGYDFKSHLVVIQGTLLAQLYI